MGGLRVADEKMAHVNLMTDTIIANLPEDGLRSVMRSMLAMDPSITPTFENRTKVYLLKHCASPHGDLVTSDEGGMHVTSNFRTQQGIVRAMLGCGMCYQSLPLLTAFVQQTSCVETAATESNDFRHAVSSVDGDIIQALTAIQKTLLTNSGLRNLDDVELALVSALFEALLVGEEQHPTAETYPFARSLDALRASQLLPGIEDAAGSPGSRASLITISPLAKHIETFTLANKTVPRLFSGLWQLSSPSWGTASSFQIQSQFSQYAAHGFTAYDMADHYGDAEILFGKFRSGSADPELLFGATKYCIFTPTTITREVVQAAVTERCQRMSATYVDLLQFHWQDYSDSQYLTALQYLQDDQRVRALGLCSFDTQHMREVLDSGITIVTNQVQFSLIDSRPLTHMAELCTQHGVKLLTYGTLLGGFLSEKWLGKPEPASLFAETITPSQRKYYEMILNWGSWQLFQELLTVLSRIATYKDVSVSNVATRWVLDFPFVGAVIVGTRWGVSDNAEDNLKVYGMTLDDTDRDQIEMVLQKSRRTEMVRVLGDCGGDLDQAFPTIYGFSNRIVGLAYLGFGIGCAIGLYTIGVLSDRLTIRSSQRSANDWNPEVRLPPPLPGSLIVPIGLLWYGWSAEAPTHWIVPIIGTSLVRLGTLAVYMPVQSYLIDAFTLYASSAAAANTIFRSLLRAFLPLAGPSLYRTLGQGLGNTLLAGIAAGFTPLAWVIWRFGERIRTRCPGRVE